MQELNYHALTGLFKYSQFHAIHINPFLKPFPNMIKHMQTLGMSHPHLFSVAHNFLAFMLQNMKLSSSKLFTLICTTSSPSTKKNLHIPALLFLMSHVQRACLLMVLGKTLYCTCTAYMKFTILT